MSDIVNIPVWWLDEVRGMGGAPAIDDHVTTYCPKCNRDTIHGIADIDRFTVQICLTCGHTVTIER
jgi:hypothetical protein